MPQQTEGNVSRSTGMQVWKDFPMFGWDLRYMWDELPGGWEKEKVITDFVNLNRLTALLTAARESVSDGLAWFALITFRAALEMPPDQNRYGLSSTHPFEAYILAAAVWIEIVGVQMYYEWKDITGKGGPLRKGGQGFREERWRFWREDFGEVARSSDSSTGRAGGGSEDGSQRGRVDDEGD